MSHNKTIRIGFDATPLARKVSGVGRYSHSLISAYASQYPEIELWLICFQGDTIDPAYKINHPNVHIYTIPLPRKLYQVTYRKLFRPNLDPFLRKLHLDALLCTNFTLFPFTKDVPAVVVVHDLAYVRFPETIEKKNLAYLRKHVPQSIKKAARVVAVSEFTKSELVSSFNISASSIDVVSPGVADKTHMKPTERTGAILTVGTLEPRKNLLTLLRAYTSLPESFKNTHPLMIAGANGWGERVESVKDKHIHFLGYVSDDELDSLYASASLFIFPSIYEGLGLPLLEAFQSNTPAIAANIPPFREVGGNTITYFDPGSTDSIAKAIVGYFKNPYTDASLAAAKKRAQQFSWDKAAKQLHQTISSVLRK